MSDAVSIFRGYAFLMEVPISGGVQDKVSAHCWVGCPKELQRPPPGCPWKIFRNLERIWFVAPVVDWVRLVPMFIKGLGNASPPHRYTQKECWLALEASTQVGRLLPRSRGLLKKVLTGRNGIAARHLALDALEEAFEISPDTLQARFARHAPVLAAEAASNALGQAKTAARQIDAVIVSTCTGYLCPGLTSYVSELLGLRADVLALDLVGQGCGAALPNLRTAESLLLSGNARHVLCICVEVCSSLLLSVHQNGRLITDPGRWFSSRA